ncbi:Phosphoesterases [Plasmopara halstedii]|uniref:Phosphoesterases n=1 Tax=Plasmopara halstedii TaxID=4781 RepID=A0A0P1AWN1_PLAHL|nr:Phosphoesterases [Plasmopara halstedii]CEG45970.1 Phosphoesterases [Plasmopara halstedii]|eukprot:XP_024582339.1 Phosphoesterases [Plasmopara halstedii]
MAIVDQVLKRIPHAAPLEQILAALVAVVALFFFILLLSIYYLYGFAGCFTLILITLSLGLRWVYFNGVGVMGWQSAWLRNSNLLIKSLSSDPKHKGTLRVVCISDTHTKHRRIQNLPDGDVLLHCGDFTNRGTHDEIRDFNDWLGTLPHRHKVVIAGNHDVSMDAVEYDQHWDKAFRHMEYNDPSLSRALLTNCTYLENRSIVIEKIKFYGSPMTPLISGRAGAFHLARGFADQQHWNKVPANVDVLVTHGPPYGILDLTVTGHHVGSETLLRETLSRIRPRYHVFGHIHEAYGATRVGNTVFVNAATSTLLTKPYHAPIVLDIPIPC